MELEATSENTRGRITRVSGDMLASLSRLYPRVPGLGPPEVIQSVPRAVWVKQMSALQWLPVAEHRWQGIPDRRLTIEPRLSQVHHKHRGGNSRKNTIFSLIFRTFLGY